MTVRRAVVADAPGRLLPVSTSWRARRIASRNRYALRRCGLVPLLLAAAVGAWPAAGARDVDPATTISAPATTASPAATASPDPSAADSVPPASDADSVPPAPGGSDPLQQAPLPDGRAADEGMGEDVAADAPPDPSVTVPPDAAAAPPSLEQQQVAAALASRLDQARLGLMVSIGLEAQAASAVTTAEMDVADSTAKLAAAERDERRAAVTLDRQQFRVRQWAVEAYAGGSLRRVAYVLESDDLNDLPRRLGLAGGVLDAFQESADQQELALDALAERRGEVAKALSSAEERLHAARAVAAEAGAQVPRHRDEVAALDAGHSGSIAGVAFPVAGVTRFIDTFGAPRMTGTSFAHAHEGVDIFAVPGAPVVAFERGAVVRLGTDVLGGTKLWLVGQSGTTYYYAHLQAYAPGLSEGKVVEVGQTLASVGNTGNAQTTPHHLHFEIHPGGGPAVNPYPVLAQIAETIRPGGTAPAPVVPVPSAPAVVATSGERD